MTNTNSSQPPDDPWKKRAEALKLALFIETILPLYERHFLRVIFKDPKFATDKHLAVSEDFKRIVSFEGMLTGFDLWRHSDYPGVRGFELAGMAPNTELDPLTASGRGNYLFAISGLPEPMRSTAESFIINERRIIDAMVRFGLAVKDNTKPCYRPVSATDDLDDLVFGLLDDLGGI